MAQIQIAHKYNPAACFSPGDVGVAGLGLFAFFRAVGNTTDGGGVCSSSFAMDGDIEEILESSFSRTAEDSASHAPEIWCWANSIGQLTIFDNRYSMLMPDEEQTHLHLLGIAREQ